ncbi:hypothetical protein H9L39_04464 [Fusarium oxysporum f. sp. albedinis]|nr:hypothetical protein H9L39_04464 [Fusarium oxysporum f. sp. albedinis]
MVDKIITVKSVFDWTIEHTPSHSMPLANPKHAQDLISISLLTITKLKTKPQLDAYIRVGVTTWQTSSCSRITPKDQLAHCMDSETGSRSTSYQDRFGATMLFYQEPTVRGLQRKARLADLSSPHDVFCYQGTPCKMPHAIVCFLEDELNVLSKWEL